MADLQTALNYFLNDLYAGTLGVTNPISKILVGDGTAGAPAVAFAAHSTDGIFSPNGGAIDFAVGGVGIARLATDFKLSSSGAMQWSSGAYNASADVSLSRGAPGQLNSNSSIARTDANGQVLNVLQSLTELTTIAAAATTDTTIQMPANSVVLGVSVRVTVVIPTAATFTVGDSGSATRFSTAAVSTAANSTDPGTKAGAYYNASALSVRITPNLTPAANTGRVRVTIYYYTITPPTS